MNNKYTDLKRQAEAMLSQLTRGKEFIIAHVSDRLTKVADENPQDHVIRAMAHVIERMSRKDPTRIISQAELEEVYQRLVGLNKSTRFREVLGELLLTVAPEPVKSGEAFAQSNRDPLKEAIDEIDPELRSTLGGMFEPLADRYDPQLAVAAKEKVSMELRSLGFQPRIKLVGGNKRFLVFAAEFQTPRGTVTAHIPAESSGEHLPTILVSGDRFEPLTKLALRTHVETTGRGDIPLSVSAILNSLDMLTGQAVKATSEQQFGKVASAIPEGTGTGLSAPTVFASMPDPDQVKDVEIPRIKIPEPLHAIAEDVEEQVIESALEYPLASIRLAKRMLYAELVAMGFKGAQIRISSSTGDGLICEAVLNTPRGKVAIEVPIEMRNNQPLMPSVFAQGDFIDDFSQKKLSAFVVRDARLASTAVRRDSPLLTHNIGQLKDSMSRAAAIGDLKTCDEILEVIAERFSGAEYREAIKSYQAMLRTAGVAKKAHDESRCSRIIRSRNSIHPLCGHLMVPIHEVVQDKYGICHRASSYHARKGQEEESTFFSNAKVLVGD